MPRLLYAFILAVAVVSSTQISVAEEPIPAGCKLADDDPLRAEVNSVMQAGADFEAQQRATLEDKVTLLARARAWNKAEEDAYLRRAVLVGNNESWDRMLTVAAAFIRVCEEQNDGNQRAEAVRLFRELYAVEEKQWRSIHESVDKDLAAATRVPGN
jgi:hypothetical protein